MRQLVAFEESLEALRAADIDIVAVSADEADDAEAMKSKTAISFPLGYGLPLLETARTLGCFYEERRAILHATGFLLRPDGVVSVACYSSGAIGRLEPESVLRLVGHLRSRPVS